MRTDLSHRRQELNAALFCGGLACVVLVYFVYDSVWMHPGLKQGCQIERDSFHGIVHRLPNQSGTRTLWINHTRLKTPGVVILLFRVMFSIYQSKICNHCDDGLSSPKSGLP